MLRIYEVSLQVLRELRGTIDGIEKRDPDLARQARRCGASVVLNIAEGSGSIGRNQRARYATALGSAKELRGCVDVALAGGYVDDLTPSTRDRLERVIATLINLVR